MVLYFVFLKMQLDDTFFMKQAMAEAEKAFHADEVPVGAVVVVGDRIIARAHNLTERLNDVTAHAEMQAITSAANFLIAYGYAGAHNPPAKIGKINKPKINTE